MWQFRNSKVHSPIYRTCFLLGYTIKLFGFILQLLGGILQLPRDNGQLLGLAPQLLGHNSQLFGQDPLLVFQVPCVGLRKVSFALGPLDILLREVPGLFEFSILRSKGLHSLYQLAALLGNSRYLLQNE